MIYPRIFWIFFNFAFLSFGGVAGVLAELQRSLVEQHHWVTRQQFVQSFVVGQLVPGPNMAMCPLLGYQIAGVGGWVAAFLGSFSVPLLMMAAAFAFYHRRRESVWIRRVERSLRPLVYALILASTITLFRESAGAQVFAAAIWITAAAYLNGRRGMGAMSVMFVSGVLWWAMRIGVPALLHH